MTCWAPCRNEQMMHEQCNAVREGFARQGSAAFERPTTTMTYDHFRLRHMLQAVLVGPKIEPMLRSPIAKAPIMFVGVWKKSSQLSSEVSPAAVLWWRFVFV